MNGFVRAFADTKIEKGAAADFWKHELTGAFDGGCMFFHAAFDVATQTFVSVACNRDPMDDFVSP